MTYKHRYCIPFLQYKRSNGTQDPISYGWTKSCGADETSPSSLWYFVFPAGMTTRDMIHVRVGIKEPTTADRGFKLYFCEANSSYSSDDLVESYILNPDDTANEAKYPVMHLKKRGSTDLAACSTNNTCMRSWVSPSESGSGTVYMHGLLAWVEKNVGGP